MNSVFLSDLLPLVHRNSGCVIFDEDTSYTFSNVEIPASFSVSEYCVTGLRVTGDGKLMVIVKHV